MCGWRASADDVLQRDGPPSQTEPASTPEAFQDQPSSGGPVEKYQCSGQVSSGLSTELLGHVSARLSSTP